MAAGAAGGVLTERQEVPPDDALASGQIRIVSKVGFNDGRIQLRADGQTKTDMILIRPGDLVVSGINAAKGAIAVYGEENTQPIAATIHYGAYIPNKERIDVRYLWWLLRSGTFRDLLLEFVPGGIKTELKAKRLLPIPVPFPILSEQQRIVARIEELAAKIEEARELRRHAMEEAETLIKRSLSKIFDYRTSDPLPKGWRWKLLDALLVNDKEGMTTGPFGTLLQKSDIQSEGIPVLGIVNVQANRFVPGFSDYVDSWKADSLSSYKLRPDDIVIARSGTVGRSCFIPPGINPAPIMSTNLIRLRLDKEIFLPQLLCGLFNGSSLVERHKDSECRGSTRTFFTQKILSKLQIPVPSLPEQRRIVAYLDNLQAKVDALKHLQTETAAELDALLPSLLDKAFKGEL